MPISGGACQKCCASAPESNRHLPETGRKGRFTNPRLCSLPLSSRALERFPITWNHVIDKEPVKIKELEHVRIEKAGQLFRDML